MARKIFTYDKHRSPVSPCGKVSMTDQQFLDDCDINKVLKRYQITGNMPANKPVRYGDFSDTHDFAAVMERVEAARRHFETLSSDVRARFGNDPRAFYDFVLDPANREECIRIGLASESVPEESGKKILGDIRDALKNGTATNKGTAPAGE